MLETDPSYINNGVRFDPDRSYGPKGSITSSKKMVSSGSVNSIDV